MRTPSGLAAKPGVPATSGSASALGPPRSDAALCERAILAIWQRLDAHDLVDREVRVALAELLEPLAALPLGGRPQRLIQALRMPDPIDAAQLYWLTRRLLTLVPELQALRRGGEAGGTPPPPVHH